MDNAMVDRRLFLKGGIYGAGVLATVGIAGCGGNSASSQQKSGSGGYSGPLAVTLYTSFADSAPIVVAVDQGYFRDHGLNLTVTNYESGADAVRGIAAGSHMGTAGVFTALGAYAAGLKQFRLVGTLQRQNTLVFLVRSDSPIQSPAELKGKKIGLTGGTSATNYVADLMLKSVNLTLNDVTQVKTTSSATALTALENQVIDCAWSLPPLSTQAIEEKRVRLLYSPEGKIPPQTDSALFVDSAFLDSNAEVVKNYVAAIVAGQQYIRQQTDAAANIYSKVTKVSPSVSRTMLESLKSGYDIAIQRDGIENTISAGESVGLYKKGAVTYEEIVDARFV